MLNRCNMLKKSALTAESLLGVPPIGLSAELTHVGRLAPNTGGGGAHGANMAAATRRVAEEINAQGGNDSDLAAVAC